MIWSSREDHSKNFEESRDLKTLAKQVFQVFRFLDEVWACA